MSRIFEGAATVIFFRDDESSYPVRLDGRRPAEIDIGDFVSWNPDTARVEAEDGEVLWERPAASAFNDGLPADWFTPNWGQEAWHAEVSGDLQAVWTTFTIEQRQALARQALGRIG